MTEEQRQNFTSELDMTKYENTKWYIMLNPEVVAERLQKAKNERHSQLVKDAVFFCASAMAILGIFQGLFQAKWKLTYYPDDRLGSTMT